MSYQDWAVFHIDAFGLRFDGEDEMVVLWVASFKAAGFQPSELFEASKWMISESAPQRPSEHLVMIQKRIHAKRAQQMQPQGWTDRGIECRTCDDVGLVVVPHAKYFTDGIWLPPFPTFAVTCKCHRGQKAEHDAKERESPMLSLEKYEAVYRGDWIRAMQQRHEAKVAEEKALAHTRFVDNVFSSTLAKIAKRAEELKGKAA